MDVRHLRYFLAVAETLNYSRAAERLVMAASPLSRSIQQLESELGGRLFERGTRKVELTPLGVALIPHAEKTIADMDALVRDMRRRVQGSREMAIGMRSLPPEVIRAVVDDVVHATDPAALVRLEPMESFDQMDQVAGGRLSLGLVNRRSEDRRLHFLPVVREKTGLALPDRPEYAGLDFVHPKDLAGLRLLLQPGVESLAAGLEPFRDAAIDVVQTTTSIVGGLAAVIAEGGFCCLTPANPSAPWHRFVAGDGVVVRPLALEQFHSMTYLCWRTDRDNADDLGPFIALARERFPEPMNL
ncbi:LysR family transcriptional regulator [Streptomyces sp. NPDC051569]|uniref:LysR family transcriptional regulator n=1 Tax=Streptomyces sp. NPDC051569 TaxID=3365661 RepID=UPI0037AE3FD1